MHRKISLLFVWLIFLVIQSYSQDPFDGSYSKVIPVSPNAAALFKATDRPPGSFTGTTPISIPLYTVTCGDLSIPVSLNYSNGGIKVEEVASSVGLGWSLSAGGTITRVVNGLADDNPQGYGYLDAALKPSGFPGSFANYDWLYNINDVLRDRLDVEPDLYFFNINGISGKFYFDESGHVKLVDKAPIKIEPIFGTSDYGTLVGWTITDDKGNQYEFGAPDYSYSEYESVGSYSNVPSFTPAYYSAWHLVKITDMTGGHEIDLEYGGVGTYFETISGGYTKIGATYGWDCLSQDNYGDAIYAHTYGAENYLTAIYSDKDSLIFYSSSSRLDFGANQLDSIRSYAKNGGGLRKRFHLNYDYFSNGGSGAFNKRLKLKNVSEFGFAGTDSIKHSFDYIEDVNLPSRISTGVDYWGYYNGQDYNSTFLPNGVYYDVNNYPLVIDYYADRRSNSDYAKANTLKKITFPTGGTREFVYEGNKYLMEYDSHVTPDASYYNYQEFDTTAFDTNPYATNAYQHYFTVNTDNGASSFNFYFDGYTYDSYHVTIYRVYSPYSESEVFTFNNDLSGNFDLSNGDYRLEVKFDNYYGYYGGLYGINCWYTQLDLPDSTVNWYGAWCYRGNMTTGGIRVKEIKDYDPVTDKTSTTKYKYNSFSDTAYSSGQLISPVVVAHHGGCGSPYRDCEYMRISATSCYPLVAESGSYVVYPEVTTYEDGNGYMQTRYSFDYNVRQEDIPSDEFPVMLRQDNSWRRNKLLYQKQYDSSGNLLHQSQRWNLGVSGSPLETAENYNSQMMVEWQRGYKVTGYWQTYSCNSNMGSDPPPCSGCWGYYEHLSHFDGLKATNDITYSTGGGSQENKTEYEYYYNDSARPVLRRERTVINRYDTMLTYHVYAFNSNSDFKLGLSSAEVLMKDSLKTLNYVQPLETRSYVKQGSDSTLISATKFTFGSFNGGKKLPSVVKKFTSTSDSSVLHLTRYDNYGNLQEQYKDTNTREVYLWGYNNTYPVAKVTGSDYSTIIALVNNSVLQNPSSDAALRTELNNIRTGLANSKAQVTTYTYKPLIGMTSETDPSGKITFYEYDVFNRLMLIKDQNGKILKKICYLYNGQQGSCTLYGNVQKIGSYTKNNCSSGYIGSTVNDTVPANIYYDYTQAAADAQAQAYLNANGQAYANAHGTCTQVWYNVQKSGNFTRNDCGSGYTGSTETYTVPANTYSSTTSQAAADALAQNDVNTNGQNYANTYGTCTADNFTLYYQKNNYSYYPIYFTFTNMDTYEEYDFQTPYGYYPTTGTLGSLPPGYYEVEIYNPYNSNYYYETSCYDYAYGYTYAYFYYTYLDDYCNTMIIDY